MSLVYLDASAGALMEFLRAWPDRVSSTLPLVEVPRALRHGRFGAYDRRLAAAAERVDLEVLAPS